MTNHVHLIVSMQPGYTMHGFVRDCKKFTSKMTSGAIENNMQESRKAWMLNMFSYAGKNSTKNKEHQFWQEEYRPIMLDTEEKLYQRLNYLHNNPVRAGFVWQAEDYKYSSAIDYFTDMKGLLLVTKLL